MALITERFLICDFGCGRTFGVDNRHRTGKEHRNSARQEGWKVINGKDYCPDCLKQFKK